MYGLLVTFESSIPLDQLEVPFTEYAHALNEIPGLLKKAWLNDGSTVGGFHLFVDRAASDAYLACELAAGLMATDGFDGFETRGFEVLEKLSAMTGVNDLVPLAG